MINSKTSKTATTILVVIISVVALLAVPAIAHAEEPGTYTISTAPSYTNPTTGVIEDRGQNAAIGQGMTESMIDPTALFEVYDDEQSYVTIRCNLMDNVGNLRFSYQTDGQSEFVAVPHTVMQKLNDGTTADLRFALPDVGSLVKAEMFITPMGRDIVFFIGFANPTLGSADFIVTEAQTPEPQTTTAIVEPETAKSAPEQRADSNSQIITLAAGTLVTVAVIAIIGLLIYKKKSANAKQ